MRKAKWKFEKFAQSPKNWSLEIEPGPCGTIAWPIIYQATHPSNNSKLHQHTFKLIFQIPFFPTLLPWYILALKLKQEPIPLSGSPSQNYKCRKVWKWSLNHQRAVKYLSGFALHLFRMLTNFPSSWVERTHFLLPLNFKMSFSFAVHI